MTQQTIIDGYRSQLGERLERAPYLADMRRAAFDRFAERGFPGQKDELFRYADIKRLGDRAYGWTAKPADQVSLPEPLGEPGARIVISNGAYCEASSVVGEALGQVAIRRLGNHVSVSESRSSELLTTPDSLGQLNTALLTDGVAISVPSGVQIDAPIEIIHVMQGVDGQASHPRIIIELGEASRITVIERFVGNGQDYWVNAVTQVRGAENSALTHCRLAESAGGGLITSATHLRLGAEARYRGLTAALGAESTRFSLAADLLSEGIDVTADGVALAGAGQTHDAYYHVTHAEAGAVSDQVFRTVAAKRGTSSFTGKVTVAKDAQQTEADQSFKALLLDRTGTANAKPELEILADDVKCSHGATVGELDQKALFYLMARGIDKATATHMLVEAFLGDALIRFVDTPVGDYVQARTAQWMDDHRDEAANAGQSR